MSQEHNVAGSTEHVGPADADERLVADGKNSLKRPSGSMYQYPRRPRTMMWFLYICGAILIVGGIYVAIKQFGEAAASGGTWDVVAGVIGVILVGIGAALVWQGYLERPVNL